jgi:hypothetical protein
MPAKLRPATVFSTASLLLVTQQYAAKNQCLQEK